jgi:hypothetical protein
MQHKVLVEMYKKYIYATPPKTIIADETTFLCHLTWAVAKAIGATTMKVYVSTRMLKHLYDSRPAEEFVFIIENLHTIAKYPDQIYENKAGKRGDFCFVKELKGERYTASIEIAEREDKKIFVATAFRLRKESYLNNYKLLWSWRDDHPSS